MLTLGILLAHSSSPLSSFLLVPVTLLPSSRSTALPRAVSGGTVAVRLLLSASHCSLWPGHHLFSVNEGETAAGFSGSLLAPEVCFLHSSQNSPFKISSISYVSHRNSSKALQSLEKKKVQGLTMA